MPRRRRRARRRASPTRCSTPQDDATAREASDAERLSLRCPWSAGQRALASGAAAPAERHSRVCAVWTSRVEGTRTVAMVQPPEPRIGSSYLPIAEHGLIGDLHTAAL